MMTEIEKRIRIIKALKSSYGVGEKPLDKRITRLKGFILMYLVLGAFAIGLVLLSIISEFIGNQAFAWRTMGLLTIFSTSFILRIPKDLHELKLLNHSKKLENQSDFLGLEELNYQLSHIVRRINKNKKFIILIPLLVVIFILAILQINSESLHPFWNYAKIPVLLFYSIIFIDYYIKSSKLNKNIKEVENTLLNDQQTLREHIY